MVALVGFTLLGVGPCVHDSGLWGWLSTISWLLFFVVIFTVLLVSAFAKRGFKRYRWVVICFSRVRNPRKCSGLGGTMTEIGSGTLLAAQGGPFVAIPHHSVGFDVLVIESVSPWLTCGPMQNGRCVRVCFRFLCSCSVFLYDFFLLSSSCAG